MNNRFNESTIIASIFYNRSLWHLLLKDAIESFINKRNDIIKSFRLFVCTHQGDHITIIIEPVRISQLLQLEKDFLSNINNYITQHQSITNLLEYPLPSFFMDYPNNSVWLDIDKHLVLSEEPQKIAQEQISEAIIGAFEEIEFSIENTYTFLIYMQLSIIRAIFIDIKEAHEKSIELLNSLAKQEKVKENNEITIDKGYNYEEIKLSIENNEEALLEIIKDIWSTNYGLELKWLATWISYCKSIVNKSNFELFFINLTDLIYDHVGLRNTNLAFLSTKIILNSFNKLSRELMNT
jgi:hypothetical protein